MEALSCLLSHLYRLLEYLFDTLQILHDHVQRSDSLVQKQVESGVRTNLLFNRSYGLIYLAKSLGVLVLGRVLKSLLVRGHHLNQVGSLLLHWLLLGAECAQWLTKRYQRRLC